MLQKTETMAFFISSIVSLLHFFEFIFSSSSVFMPSFFLSLLISYNFQHLFHVYLQPSRATGHLPYSTALEVTTYLPMEEDFVPWAAAFENIAFVTDMLKDTAAYGALRVSSLLL